MLRPLRLRLPGLVVTAAVAGLSGCLSDDRPAAEPSDPWTVRHLDEPRLSPGMGPNVSPGGDGVVLSWWAPAGRGADGGDGTPFVLRAAAWSPDTGLGPVRDVVEGDDFFVNWADLPSVVPVGPRRWVAHWLQRNGADTYAYGIRVAESADAGRTWSRAWIPHDDTSPTEHGFASILADGHGGWEMVWLDGRKYAAGEHGPATDEMTVRSRHVGADGASGAEDLLDPRGCDCCQTDLAATDRGPVAVYRDRTEDEVRDIALVRREGEGWTDPRPVSRDGWVMPGCPVNGPAVDAAGSEVVVAWFTAAGDVPRVLVAFSDDAGDTFGEPIAVAGGEGGGTGADVLGRVDVVRTAPGEAAVSWIEVAGPPDRRRGAVQVRQVRRGGERSSPLRVGTTGAGRGGGFPGLAALADGRILVAWNGEGEGTGGPGVRLALLESTGGEPSAGEATRREPTEATGDDRDRGTTMAGGVGER